MTKLSSAAILVWFVLSAGLTESFLTPQSPCRPLTELCAATSGRRAFLVCGAAAWAFGGVTNPSFAEQAPEYRQGIQVNAFNGLIFNYRGSDFGGLAATSLNEPSVSYAEFNQKLKAGEVDFVEFLAPDGDAAYVTFKAKQGEPKASPLRIGEGYPIEQHDGYSSPMFCVRAVKNAGVPYKFTVPALTKFNN
jgi:hypothetical protein